MRYLALFEYGSKTLSAETEEKRKFMKVRGTLKDLVQEAISEEIAF